MARLPDGRILTMYAPGRPFKEADLEGPEQPVYLRLSSDHGQTWNEPQRVFAYPAGRGSFSQKIYPLVDRKGNIHAFNIRYYRFPKRGTQATGYSELIHTLSRDEGKTWSPPNRVDFGHAYSGAINSIIELKSGRLLVALSYMSDRFVESAQQFEFRCVFSYSEDGGETWKLGTDNLTVPIGPLVVHPGAIEPVLVELKEGRVWMIFRTQTLRFLRVVFERRWENLDPSKPDADHGARFTRCDPAAQQWSTASGLERCLSVPDHRQLAAIPPHRPFQR
jgi:BNR repeat-like domain